MSFAVSFHRAAKAEFIEASAGYEDKRRGLGIEFMAEIERFAALNILINMPLPTKTFNALLPTDFRTAFIFVSRRSALSSWQYFTAEETLLYGRGGFKMASTNGYILLTFQLTHNNKSVTKWVYNPFRLKYCGIIPRSAPSPTEKSHAGKDH